MKKLGLAVLAVLMLSLLPGCAVPDDPAPPEDADIEVIAVDLINDLSEGDFAGAAGEYAYTGQMKRVVNEKFMKEQVWEYLVNTYGAFQGFGEPMTAPVEEYENVIVVASFESADINIVITFDSNKLIAGIHCVPVQ